MLFKDTADLKRVLTRINTKYNDAQVLSFVEQAEIKYIIPYLGQAQYDEINEAYEDVASIDLLGSTDKALLEKIQLPLAYYAILDALPMMNVVIGQSGIGEQQSANVTQSRQWVYNNLENSLANNADIFMDKLLEFLEANADTYSIWKASEAYTANRELFISQTSQFQKYINIFNSRRAFVAFRPFILECQEEIIRIKIGDDYYEDLKTKYATDTLTIEDRAVLRIIEPALAYYAYAIGVVQILVQFTGSGLKVLGNYDSISQRSASSPEELTNISNKYRPRYEQKFTELKVFLDANADTYPLYKASSAYTAPEDPKTYELPDNSNSKSFSV